MPKKETFIYENKEYYIDIGKDMYENWDLIDNSKQNDIWFHVESSPSSHVFLRTEMKINKVPRQVIKRCACLCKSNSTTKSMKNVNIIYTNIYNIEKGKHIGSVISKNTKTVII